MNVSDLPAARSGSAGSTSGNDAPERGGRASRGAFAEVFDAVEREAPRSRSLPDAQRRDGGAHARRPEDAAADRSADRSTDTAADARAATRRDEPDSRSDSDPAASEKIVEEAGAGDAAATTAEEREALLAQGLVPEEWVLLSAHESPAAIATQSSSRGVAAALAAATAAEAAAAEQLEPTLEGALRQWVAAQAGADAQSEALRGQAGQAGAAGDAGLLLPAATSVDGAVLAMDPASATSPAGSARSAAAMAAPLVPADPDFPEALTERVRWQLEEGRSSAELRLDPPSLGSLSVRIRLERDEASILFNSAQPGVREALEDALPKLRELLTDAGLRLVDVGVGGGEGDAGSEGNGGDGGRSSDPSVPDAAAAASTAGGPAARSGSGLLDAYA